MKKIIIVTSIALFFNTCLYAKESIKQVQHNSTSYNQGKILEKVEAQTDVNNATFIIKEGVPYLDIQNVGVVFHPAWTGLYALQYANSNSYYPKEVEPNEKLFFHLVKVLEDNLTYLEKDSAVWIYNFDNTYNNVYIKAPWHSSFAQAIGIEVFITAYEKTKDQNYLELAKKVAKPIITPIENSGLLYAKDADIWFEEIPLKENPTHILNAQLRSLIALDLLYKKTDDKIYKAFFDKGLATLKRWLPRYDTGEWLKYDLNPKYQQLFRITNPYGFKTTELSIDSISVLDKNQKVLVKEDIGDSDDFKTNKPIYLSGIDWKSEYTDANLTLRNIKSSLPIDLKTEFESQSLVGPYTFLNINFPKTKEKEYFVKIDYKDNKKGNLVLQKRAVAPNIKFKNVDNGMFLLKGDDSSRSLILKIDESSLGYHVGLNYAWRHYLYIEKLKEITNDESIAKWENIAKSYINTIEYKTDKIIKNESLVLPQQTPMMPLLSFDEKKVIRQHQPNENTVFLNGIYDFKSSGGKPVYSPFIIASQAIGTEIVGISPNMYENIDKEYFSSYNFITINNDNEIKKEPALNWLKINGKQFKDSLSWQFSFANSYNDMVQESGWNSAFGQAYVIKAFVENGIYDYASKGANAYKYDISKGGVSSFDKSGNIWFEEVPNKSHILNAHLISQNVLMENLDKFKSKDIDAITKNGLDSLEKYISDFDTGYWSKYDQNPKKELLFQFDWVDGDKSPLIDEVCLVSSVSHKKTCLDVGSEKDYESSDRITGLDWLASFKEDGKSVRNFRNGYVERTGVVSGGTHHNTFIWMSLPDREFIDQWDITPYYLVVKYKDISKGQFIIKSQSMREGNFLEFMPLYSSNIITQGDGKWKEHIVPIRTNDLGWYLGVDYHKYHIAQLNDIVEKSRSVLLKQVANRWQYYLEQYENKQNPIVEPQRNPSKELRDYKVSSNLKFYKGYELEKAIDGDPSSNYVASLENIALPHKIVIDLKEKKNIEKLQFIWESNANNAEEFSVEVYENSKLNVKKDIKNKSQYSEIELGQNATRVVINIKKYNGQNRLLMRAVRIFGR